MHKQEIGLSLESHAITSNSMGLTKPCFINVLSMLLFYILSQTFLITFSSYHQTLSLKTLDSWMAITTKSHPPFPSPPPNDEAEASLIEMVHLGPRHRPCHIFKLGPQLQCIDEVAKASEVDPWFFLWKEIGTLAIAMEDIWKRKWNGPYTRREFSYWRGRTWGELIICITSTDKLGSAYFNRVNWQKSSQIGSPREKDREQLLQTEQLQNDL